MKKGNEVENALKNVKNTINISKQTIWIYIHTYIHIYVYYFVYMYTYMHIYPHDKGFKVLQKQYDKFIDKTMPTEDIRFSS